MRFFTPFSSRLRSFLLSAAILIGFACGPGSSDINEFMSFFMPESARKSTEDGIYQYTPLLYRYDQWYETDTVTVDQNTLAWGTYTGGKVSPADLSQALYHHDDSPSNGLVRWTSANSPAALAYLKLAWRAEAATPKPVNAWETDTVRRDTTTAPLRSLLAEAQSGYQTARDAFLKERYAFQAVKLAALLKDYRRSVALYNELVRPLARKTFLSDWALCRHAGATMALGDTAKAIYEFAQVFDRCPSRRQEAELSLRIYGIRFREKALEFCQNDHEKAAVYAICAVQPRQDALPYLKEIVRLDPKHPLIELIMAREINRNEYYFFRNNAPLYAFDDATRADSIRFADRRQEAPSYFEQLESFARESAENQRLNDPAFWYTAASYLNYLNKNYDQAQANLEKADGALTTNPVLKKQITVQYMLLLAAQTETITPEVESKLIGYLEAFGSSANFYINNAFVEVCKQFAAKYGYGKEAAQSSGGWFAGCSRKKDAIDNAAPAKAFLLTALTSSQLNRNDNGYFLNQSDLYDIEDTTTVATVQNVIRFASQSDLSDFGKRLLKLTGFNNDQLYILLGRRLLVDNKLAEAADAYAKVAPNGWEAEPFTTYFNENPFRINPTRKQHGAQHTNPYTPATFLQRMIDLEKEAKAATGDQAAERYYELGCGAYNLSWYGNAWLLARPRWSGAEPSSNVYSYQAVVRQAETDRNFEKLATDPYYTNAPAKAFFERAMQLAKNPELAAKACFLAARCEQDAFRTRQDLESARRGYSMDQNQFDRDMKTLKKRQYSTYLSKLSQAYSTTRFNKETIRECATYADFLKGK